MSKIETTFGTVFNKSPIGTNKLWCEFYGVFNLSNYSCDQNELSVLGKGLKFCPTPPKYCHSQLKESKINSSGQLRSNNSLQIILIHEPEDSFLSEKEPDTAFEHEDLKLPSTFNPPIPNTLEHIYDILIDGILRHNPDFSHTRNMTLA